MQGTPSAIHEVLTRKYTCIFLKDFLHLFDPGPSLYGIPQFLFDFALILLVLQKLLCRLHHIRNAYHNGWLFLCHFRLVVGIWLKCSVCRRRVVPIGLIQVLWGRCTRRVNVNVRFLLSLRLSLTRLWLRDRLVQRIVQQSLIQLKLWRVISLRLDLLWYSCNFTCDLSLGLGTRPPTIIQLQFGPLWGHPSPLLYGSLPLRVLSRGIGLCNLHLGVRRHGLLLSPESATSARKVILWKLIFIFFACFRCCLVSVSSSSSSSINRWRFLSALWSHGKFHLGTALAYSPIIIGSEDLKCIPNILIQLNGSKGKTAFSLNPSLGFFGFLDFNVHILFDQSEADVIHLILHSISHCSIVIALCLQELHLMIFDVSGGVCWLLKSNCTCSLIASEDDARRVTTWHQPFRV